MWILTQKYVGCDEYVNDLFVAAFEKKPNIEELKKILSDHNASYILEHGECEYGAGAFYLKEMQHGDTAYNGMKKPYDLQYAEFSKAHSEHIVNDCIIIQKELEANGHNFTLQECYNIWVNYSDTLAASWLNVGNSDPYGCIILSDEFVSLKEWAIL